GAMNLADTSVEPLDVAFLRRWAPYRLKPLRLVVDGALGTSAPVPLVATPTSAVDVLNALVAAWEAVNERIATARGPDFELGHGVLLANAGLPTTVNAALEFASEPWKRIKAHVDEVFFGDLRGTAAAL